MGGELSFTREAVENASSGGAGFDDALAGARASKPDEARGRGARSDRAGIAAVLLACGVIAVAGAVIYGRYHYVSAPAPVKGAAAASEAAKPEAANRLTPEAAPAALKYSDTSASAELNRRGLALYRAGLYKDAAGEFSAALAADDGPAARHVYYNNLAQSYAAMGDEKAAEEFLFTSVTVKPDYPVAVNNMGVIYSNRGAGVTARELFERALSMNPDYPEAHFNLAATLDGSGHLTDAARHYERSVELDPSQPGADGIRTRARTLKAHQSATAARRQAGRLNAGN